MDKMLKCRLTGNMSQRESKRLIPILKSLKKWKDIANNIHGKEKAKLNAFKNWVLNRLLIYRGFWNCLCLYIAKITFSLFPKQGILEVFLRLLQSLHCSHGSASCSQRFLNPHTMGSLAHTFNSRDQTLLCLLLIRLLKQNHSVKFNIRVSVGLNMYTHTATGSLCGTSN